MQVDTDAFLAKARNGFGSRPRSAESEHAADEQLRMVWAHARIGSLVATAFALVLAMYLRGVAVPANVVDTWLGIKVGVTLARVLQSWHYMRLGQPGGAGWRNITDLMLAVDGAVWGAAGVWMLAAPIPFASLIGAALVCVSCIATFGLQVSRRSTAAYVLPILLPSALALLLRRDEFGWVGGAGLLMLVGLQLVTARRSERRLLEGVLLRLQAQALVREKDEALKLALRQSAVKTQFLANISHELRTPLHGILGLARLLHLEARDPVLAHRVELIEASGTHLLGLINDLLDISRIEAGQFAMRSESFDLSVQVDHVAGVYAVRAGEKGLRFVVSSQLPRPCWVQGDPARFRQVLHNLLGNAVKFTERGFVSLTVSRADAGASAQGEVRAEVRDSGVGIASADLARIFDAFQQSGGAANHPSDGAGLGLTIARDIAQAMGGDIAVQSQVGVGSTLVFTAALPARAAPDAAAAPARAAAPGAPQRLPAFAVGPHDGQAWRVLLAEDDEVNALIAMSYLERFGVQAERVHDGREAVRQALREGGRPHVVLMDCRMPELDGFAATREIRSAELALGLQRVPVIALTATAGDSDQQLCLEAGMDDFLAKPYSGDALALALQRWIGPITSAQVARTGVTP